MKSLAVLLLATTAFAQTQIRCGTLIDGRSDTPRRNVTITIQGNKIVSVSEAAATANAIDAGESDSAVIVRAGSETISTAPIAVK